MLAGPAQPVPISPCQRPGGTEVSLPPLFCLSVFACDCSQQIYSELCHFMTDPHSAFWLLFFSPRPCRQGLTEGEIADIPMRTVTVAGSHSLMCSVCGLSFRLFGFLVVSRILCFGSAEPSRAVLFQSQRPWTGLARSACQKSNRAKVSPSFLSFSGFFLHQHLPVFFFFFLRFGCWLVMSSSKIRSCFAADVRQIPCNHLFHTVHMWFALSFSPFISSASPHA